MKRLNLFLTLSSLTVILVSIERFSFTTKILLQPYSFLRLHEVVQMLVLILFTVVIPFFLLKELSRNFELLKTRRGTILGLLFIIGVYYYSTGNGVHEIGSFLFNNYCDMKKFSSTVCGSFFFNDYYFGNILYFVGGILMNVPLLLLELQNPNSDFTAKDLRIAVINGAVFSLAVFAYAGFDRVLVGLVYSVIMMLVVDWIWLRARFKNVQIPFITYNAVAYTLGVVLAVSVRFVF